MQFAALIVDCFRHARDRKLFWVMIAISTFIAAALACIEIDGDKMTILFKWEFDGIGRAMAGAILTKQIGAIYVGWLGVILALIATAGVFPAFMERGRVDVVLAKPISRPMLFLGKYLGSMAFMAVQAAFFVVITFLVVGVRWHFWLWGYFWTIPLMILLFSYVYAFSALFGVVTRSGLAALLLTLLAWFAIVILQGVHPMLVMMQSISSDGSMIDEKWIKASKVVRVIVPKTKDIPIIAGNLIQAAKAAEMMDGFQADSQDVPAWVRHQQEAQKEAIRELEDVDIAKSVGSSLLFEAAIVLLAMWKFTRQDF